MWYNRRIHRQMHLAVGLGSNDKFAVVKWVEPTKDGGDWLPVGKKTQVKLEGDFVFMSNKESDDDFFGVPISVYDRDTGLLVRPRNGEVEMMSEARLRASRLDDSIAKIKAGNTVNWAQIAVILGVVLLLGLVVVGFLLVKIMNQTGAGVA